MNGQINRGIIARFRQQFAVNCVEGILIGYNKMLSDKQYQTDWIEDKLTAHLAAKIKETGYLSDKNIIIILQAPLYDDDVVFGEGDPAKAPRIDFKFGHIWSRIEFNYYAEAKNLSQANWTKRSGASVNAYDSRSYYISDGIERYLTGYYPEGCLIGYIVNGNVSGVVKKINHLISHRNSGPRVGFLEPESSTTSNCCYLSQNHLLDRVYLLRHLMLQLA